MFLKRVLIVNRKYQISTALYNKKCVEVYTVYILINLFIFFRTHINSSKENNPDYSK